MDSEFDTRLRSIEEKIETIEKTVKKIRSSQKTAFAMRGVYWLFIILLAFGAFYYIQPYVDQLKDLYSGAQGDIDTFNQLINQFKGQDL